MIISIQRGRYATATLTESYPFNKIFHHHITKWLLFALNSFTNSILVLNERWAVGVDLIFHVPAKEEAARC